MTKISDPGGMTMVEVTFASVVLLGAIMIMVSTFNMAVNILSFTTTRSIATQIANEEVENARGMDYEQVVNTEPAQWPDDASLDKSVVPPVYKDIDDTSSPVSRTISTTTSTGYLSVERNVIRKNSSFTIRKYVLWVSDGAVTQAYKRLVVKINWPSPGVKGEVVMVTNFAKSDTKEPRPSVSITGVKSTNFNYFKGQSEDTTMGQDDSIRGPGGSGTIRTPKVYVRASHNSAKATGISRVDFTLLSPSAAIVSTGSDSTKDANGYFTWDLSTTGGITPDNMGYVIKAVAFDTLGRSEVATMRVNIDNTYPSIPELTVTDAAAGANKRLKVSWTWDPSGDPVPFISRFIIMRKGGADGAHVQKAAVPGDRFEFTDAGLEPLKWYSYYIVAVDTAGNIRSSVYREREKTVAASDNIAPDAVATSIAAPATWKAIDLYWPPASDNVGGSGIAGYMWYASDNQVNWTIVGETANLVGNPLYYQDTGLKPGKTFYYKCYSIDVEGNMSALGPEASAATPMR